MTDYSQFAMPEYLWLVVVGSMAAFAYGWGTGSNDVANAFGTSVGAKTLTLKQAVILASIFEFTGAVVLGRVSTSTIANGIANINVFYREPEIYSYGMICALTTGFWWQALASYYEMNVSATHSIIGAIIGFSFIYGGSEAVNWATPDKTAFPPYRGVVPIICAWFFSPLLTALSAAIIFFLIRTLVLRRENSYVLSFWVLPPFVMLTFFICIFFVFTRGAKKMLQGNDAGWTDQKSAWIAAACAGGVTFLCIVIVLPILKWKADKKFAKEAEGVADEEAAAKSKEEPEPEAENQSKLKKAYMSARNLVMRGMEQDMDRIVEEDPIVAAIHKNAEVFDPKTEYSFSYLQVFSAICVIFSHGAGEVGYMAGPMTTIWYTVKDGTLPRSVNAPIWCIMISALGLVTGLATYGYNVTRAMGTRMAKLSPTRGFAAELSTALVIMVCSQYGLPTSSSQCITGGIIGVGLLEGKAGVNWKFFLQNFASWGATLFVAAFGTAALFSQGVYAPSISMGKMIVMYENQMIGTSRSIVRELNATLFNFQAASAAGNLQRLGINEWRGLNRTMASFLSRTSRALTPRTQGSIKPQDAVDFLVQSVHLLNNYTLVTIGQERVFQSAVLCNNGQYNPTTNAAPIACQLLNYTRRIDPPFNATTWPSF